MVEAIAAADGVEAIREAARRADFVFLARPDDLIHPSAAAIAAAEGEADAIHWAASAPTSRARAPPAGRCGGRSSTPSPPATAR